MNEQTFETELIRHIEHVAGSKQWQYEKGIRTTEALWQNFKAILEGHNQYALEGPLSVTEFAQVKAVISGLATPYQAGQFLYGLNGVSQVEVDLDDGPPRLPHRLRPEAGGGGGHGVPGGQPDRAPRRHHRQAEPALRHHPAHQRPPRHPDRGKMRHPRRGRGPEPDAPVHRRGPVRGHLLHPADPGGHDPPQRQIHGGHHRRALQQGLRLQLAAPRGQHHRPQLAGICRRHAQHPHGPPDGHQLHDPRRHPEQAEPQGHASPTRSTPPRGSSTASRRPTSSGAAAKWATSGTPPARGRPSPASRPPGWPAASPGWTRWSSWWTASPSPARPARATGPTTPTATATTKPAGAPWKAPAAPQT